MIPFSLFKETVKFCYDGSIFPYSEYHGDAHWRAVASQGLWLCSMLNAKEDARVTALVFGLFHDCRRHNEHFDPEHGPRAADALMESPLANHLPKPMLEVLCKSMVLHDTGKTSTDVKMALGWDADRSVLGRVGIQPSPEFFSVAKVDGSPDFDAFIARGQKLHFEAPTWDDLFETTFS